MHKVILKSLIIGDSLHEVRNKVSMRNMNNYLAFVSQMKPKSIEEAKNDPNWIVAMEEELNQFKQNNIWTLVEKTQR